MSTTGKLIGGAVGALVTVKIAEQAFKSTGLLPKPSKKKWC